MSTRLRRRRREKTEERKSVAGFEVYFDAHGRIACAKVDGTSVDYVRMLRGASLILESSSPGEFLKDFEKKEGYPADRAALIMANYSRVIGASAAALRFLGIKDKSIIEEAVSRYQEPTEVSLKSKPREKSKPKETNTRAVEWNGKEYKSMADLIRKLLLDGEDDDTIFDAMQRVYNASDGKRGYIDYYRKQLEKDNGTKRKETRRKRVRYNTTKNKRSRKNVA